MTSIALRLLTVASAALAFVVVWLAVGRTRVAADPMWQRRNYRDRTVTLLGGPVAVLVAVAGCTAVAVLAESSVRRTAVALLVVLVIAGLAGLYDDLHGDAASKGLRGHLGALRAGRLTSGGLKIIALVVAGVVAAVVARGESSAFSIVDALLIAGTANLANLLDLRPGRAAKVTVAGLLAVALTTRVGAAPLAWCAGVVAGLLPIDLRERAMLGDAGANAIGAALGVGLVAAAVPAARIAALVVVTALTLVSERVSFSRVIDATPPLRWLDRLGRADSDSSVPA